jgi:hypothetical protein
LWDLLKTCFGAVYLRQQRIEFFGDDFLFSSGAIKEVFYALPEILGCLRLYLFPQCIFYGEK